VETTVILWAEHDMPWTSLFVDGHLSPERSFINIRLAYTAGLCTSAVLNWYDGSTWLEFDGSKDCLHSRFPFLLSLLGRRVTIENSIFRVDYGISFKCKSKSKLLPLQAIEALGGESKYSSHSIMTSALDVVNCQGHAPAALYPRGKGPSVPIGQEFGWSPEPVRKRRLEDKSFAPARDRTSIVRSFSL